MMHRSLVRRTYCANASIGTNTTRAANNNTHYRQFYNRKSAVITALTGNITRSFTSSTYLYDSNNANVNNNNNNNLKEQLLNLSLKHVPYYGWNDDAIVAGAAEMIYNTQIQHQNQHHEQESVQVDGTSTTSNHSSTSNTGASSSSLSLAGLISVQDLITHLMNQWNIQFRTELLLLLQHQQQQQQGTSSEINETLETIDNTNTNNNIVSVNEQIKYLMKKRLQYPIEYIQCKRWHEGMALGIFPTQIQTTTTQLKEIIDVICYHIDCTTSTIGSINNINTTSLSSIEKVALGTIYITTELHMLQDTSTDYIDTWEFLSNRIDEWDTYRNTLLLNNASVSSFDINTILSSLSSFSSGGSTTIAGSSNHTIQSVVPIIASVATGIVSVLVPSASQYVATTISTTGSTTGLQDFIIRTATGLTTTTSTSNNNNTNNNGFIPPTLSSSRTGSNIYEITTTAIANAGTNNDGTDPSHYNVSK